MEIREYFIKKSKWILILLISLILFGCAPFFSISPQSGHASPEIAAVQAVLTGHDGTKVIADSMQVLQSFDLDGNISVLMKFQMVNDGLLMDCDYVYETHRRMFGWVSGGGGGGCSSGPVGEQQISLGGGSSIAGARSTSRAHGIVYDENITSIEVVWDDKLVQWADVINSSFLLVRNGLSHWLQVVGYDKDETVVYRWSQPDPAPGKLSP
jgi:hypothetical protein